MSRILVAEDDPHILRLISMWLRRQGHEVLEARNGLIARDLARAEPADVLVTDVNMPDIRGDEICKVLKTKYDTANIPIVLFSSKDTDELAELAERAGADGFVSKQQGFDKLIEKIDDLVGEILF